MIATCCPLILTPFQSQPPQDSERMGAPSFISDLPPYCQALFAERFCLLVVPLFERNNTKIGEGASYTSCAIGPACIVR